MRIRNTVIGVVLCGMIALVAADAAAELIRFDNGSFLQGEILESDKAGFTFKRWDTGGVVKLTWDQIIPQDRTRLKRALGLEFAEQEQGISIDAYRIHLRTGDIIEGIVLEETPDYVRVKRSTGEFKYPASLIKRKEPIEMDILTLYTEEEAYGQKLEADGEPEGADGHYEWASWCRRLGYYEKEKEHLQTVQAEAPDFKPDYIRNRLEALDALVIEAQILRRIKEINRLVARKKFAEAQEAWDVLDSEHGDHPIVADDTQGVEESIEQSKGRYLGQVVVSDWYRNMSLFVRKKALDKDFKLADAKKWLQKDLTSEILAAIADKRGIDAGDIKTAFEERTVYNVRKGDYSTGTFIVEKGGRWGGSSGSSGIIEDLGKQFGLDKKMRDKVKGLFGGQSGSSSSNKKQLTPDDWWDAATSDMKYQWMTAYYAENSGDMTVVRIEKKTCSNCNGKGYTSFLTAGGGGSDGKAGGTQHQMCPRCQGLGKERVVVFK